MAVTKLWKVEHSLKQVLDYAKNPDKTRRQKYSLEDIQSLKNVLAYAKDEEKTEQEFYVSGINCNPNKACEQYVDVKTQFGKNDGIQAYHGYMSFKDTDNVTPELAHQIGMEFARRVWGDRFQIVVTTHLNTKCLHCHFVVNSVSFADGKRMHGKEKAWFYFRHIADEVCREYNLSVIEHPQTVKHEIISVFKTITNGFDYQNYTDFADEEQFNTFMGKCKSLSLYDTDTNSVYGDRLITLSTCEYSQDNGRLVVIAKQIEVSSYEA